MKIAITEQKTFTTTDCCECGIEFALPGRFIEERREDKRSFYCPNGHSMMFMKSTAQLLKQEVDKLKREKDEVEQSRWALHNELEQKKTEVSKLQSSIKRRNKRIAAGICPCCNRTFKQLAEHMKNKHPEQVQKFPEFAIHKRINTKPNPPDSLTKK